MFTLGASGTNLLMTSLCLRNVGRHSRQHLAHQPLAGPTTTTSPTTAGDNRGAFCRHLAVDAASSLRKYIQNICSRVNREKREGEGGWWGEERGEVVVRGMGRCGGGGGGQRYGGGRQQKYVCAANLTRTFERLNPKESAAASACCTTNSQCWDRLGFFTGGAPRERRRNNYNDNLCVLHLTNGADGKYLQC